MTETIEHLTDCVYVWDPLAEGRCRCTAAVRVMLMLEERTDRLALAMGTINLFTRSGGSHRETHRFLFTRTLP